MFHLLLDINIDFETSHLFFPRIIIWITVILGLYLLIVNGPRKIKEIKANGGIRLFASGYDKGKLFGTIAVIAVYFKSMEVVGSFFPNTGYGFLIMSVVFIFVISILFLGKPAKKQWIALSASAILTPSIVWYIFGYVFFITLP